MTRRRDEDGLTLGVDLGGTHLRVALVDREGRLQQRREVPTPQADEVPGQLVEQMSALAGSATCAVVGLPGAVDYRRERLEWAPHLPASWTERLVASELGRSLGLPVALANDADLAAVGEAYFGSGRSFADVAYLTVSTGIGAGVVLGHRLVHGGRSLAEIGHTVIDRLAFRTGGRSTLESLAAGSSIPALARRAGLGALEGADLEVQAAAGQEAAGALWAEVVEATTIGVVNLVRTFRPEVVVLGGGLGLRPRFFSDLTAAYTRIDLPDHPELVTAGLADDAGLIGSAAWERAVAA